MEEKKLSVSRITNEIKDFLYKTYIKDDEVTVQEFVSAIYAVFLATNLSIRVTPEEFEKMVSVLIPDYKDLYIEHMSLQEETKV